MTGPSCCPSAVPPCRCRAVAVLAGCPAVARRLDLLSVAVAAGLGWRIHRQADIVTVNLLAGHQFVIFVISWTTIDIPFTVTIHTGLAAAAAAAPFYFGRRLLLAALFCTDSSCWLGRFVLFCFWVCCFCCYCCCIQISVPPFAI